MRFQCRIGEGTVCPPSAPLPAPVRVPRTPRTASPAAPRAAAPKRGHEAKLARHAVAGAALLAAAGCAVLEPGSAKQWKIEPVLSVTHSSQSSQAYYALGQYFDGSMAWDKAIDAYRKAIAADAKNIAAYGALGVALAQADRLADAETTLRQAVALAPDRAHIRNNLGYVLLLSGKADEAVVVLKSVVEQDRGNAIAVANLNNAMGRSSVVVAAAQVPAQLPAESPIQVPAQPPTQSPDRVATPSSAAAARLEEAAPPLDLRVGYQPTAVPAEPAKAATPTPAVPATPATPAADAPPAPKASRLEVSNGNGVTGMAARVGRWLATQGVPTERLSNRQPFAQRHTVVQYRVGREDAALNVARLLPVNAKAESQPTPGLRSDVRVVLGHDWVQVAACLERNTCRPAASLAMAGTADRER